MVIRRIDSTQHTLTSYTCHHHSYSSFTHRNNHRLTTARSPQHAFQQAGQHPHVVGKLYGEKKKMKQLLLLLGLFLLIFQDQATAWVLTAPTTSSSPSSYTRAPGGTVKVSKMKHRLRRGWLLPQASSGDGEGAGGTGKGSPTQRKRKPAARSISSNDNTALAFAKIFLENNQVMLRVVDEKLEKALGKWLDKQECDV